MLDIQLILEKCPKLSKLSLQTLFGEFENDVELLEQVPNPPLQHLQHLTIDSSRCTEQLEIAAKIGNSLCRLFSSTIENAQLIGFPTCLMEKLQTLTIFESDQLNFLPTIEECLFPALVNLKLNSTLNEDKLLNRIREITNLQSIDLYITTPSAVALEELAMKNPCLQSIRVVINESKRRKNQFLTLKSLL